MSLKRLWLIPFIILLVGSLAFAIIFPKEGTKQVSWPEALEQEYGAPAYKSIDPNKNIIGQKIRIEIGDREFEIPKVFISSPVKDSDKVDGLNLIYVMPDFTPRSAFKSKEEYREAKSARRFGHMLIRSTSVSVPVHQIYENLENSNYLGTEVAMSDEMSPPLKIESISAYEGRYRKYFIERDQSGVTIGIISCKTDQRVKFPGCSYYFEHNGLQYDVYFNKEKFLASWQETRRNAINFIESFSVTK